MLLKRFLPVALLICTSVAFAGCKNSTTGPGSNNNSGATKVIAVSGNLSFGNVTVGQAATATMTISNTGTATLAITSLGVTTGLGSVYSTSFTNGTIAAGATQSVTIQFAPTAAQSYSGTLTVNGDQTSGSNTLPISGTGILAKANLQPGSGTFSCVTGLCLTMTYPITNLGPGCASNVQVVTRAFGGDGNGAQLGVDIPMILAGGGSLSAVLFKVGTSVTIQNQSTFNDVRSAHTVFKIFITSTDVACQ